ncbi:UNVERIFIED_CONTAM: hypothetical protein FKN15_042301 [Acipenser sinensis]
MSQVKQVGLLAAGCQPWNKDVCAASGDRFAYCATLAIYVYQRDHRFNEFKLRAIMSEHKKTITAISWCPHNQDVFASASADNLLIVWNVAEQKVVTKLDNTKGSKSQKHVLRPESLEGTDEEDPVSALEWDPLSTDYLLVANLHNGIRLVDSESLSCITTFSFPSAAASVQCLAWVPSAPGMFITGGLNAYNHLIITVEPGMEWHSSQSPAWVRFLRLLLTWRSYYRTRPKPATCCSTVFLPATQPALIRPATRPKTTSVCP